MRRFFFRDETANGNRMLTAIVSGPAVRGPETLRFIVTVRFPFAAPAALPHRDRQRRNGPVRENVPDVAPPAHRDLQPGNPDPAARCGALSQRPSGMLW